MSKNLTPEQKAMARAVQLKADLACNPLQDALDKQALCNAKRRAMVSRETMADTVKLAIERKLQTAQAMLSLTASQRGTLEKAAAVGKAPKVEAESKSKGKSKSKSKSKAPAPEADSSIQ
jgi:hypothetical protein